MRHFKILGWLWLLFDLFWSVLVACALLGPSAPPDAHVTVSSKAWWQEVIGDTIECSFFGGSAVLGLGLLRRWRRAHVALGVFGIFTVGVYILLVSSPSFPPATPTQSMLQLSPVGALGLYSLIAVFICKYEPKEA